MKTLKLASIATATLLTISSVQASTLITNWGYINEAGFDNQAGTGALTSTVGSNTLTGLVGTDVKIEWGDERIAEINNVGGTYGFNNTGAYHPQSSLVVDSPVSGSVETNGDWEMGTSITHNNWVVGGGYLTSANLLDALALQPLLPFLPFTVSAPLITFNIDFIETRNDSNIQINGDTYTNYTPDNSTCENGELNGTGININGCADIFVISTETPGIDFFLEDDQLFFNATFNLNSGDAGLDDFDYTVTTRLSGVEFISSAACESVDAVAGCIGFVTKENSENTLLAEYKITSTRVPEPSVLALLGLALFGFAGMSKRKNS